ncbi:MAG: FHA domain-containing protein [Polyangiaceae bacterium]
MTGEDPACVHFALEYANQTLEVAPGEYVVGRSTSAEIILDDALVSRRHARFVVEDAAIRVEDMGSVNGVFVNGQRVNGSRLLVSGDRVVIGKQELVVRAQMSTFPPDGEGRATAVTLVGVEPVPSQRVGDDSESTHQGNAMELLGGVADKVLALGRGDEAEKIMGSYLQNLLELARSGKGPSPKLADKAAGYAVKLAAATKKGDWVDYAVELFMSQRRPLPGPVVDQLYTVLRQVSEIDLTLLRSYVAVLRAVAPGFPPADRFLAQRVEGLERLAAAK